MKLEVKNRMQARPASLAKIALGMGLVMMVTLLGGIVGCSQSDDALDIDNQNNVAAKIRADRENNTNRTETGESTTRSDRPKGYFKQVSLIAQNSSSGTSMKIEAETTEPLTETQYLSYVYWRNNQPSREGREDVIPASAYKKNELIMVEAIFHDGEEILSKMRSDQTLVPNTAPVIVDVQIPKVDGPGTFTLTTQATDADEDVLSFSLSPITAQEELPDGLSVDASSGVITYTLTAENPPKEVVQFIVSANDGDGGIAKKMVTINFDLEKTVKQEKVQKKEDAKEQKKNP